VIPSASEGNHPHFTLIELNHATFAVTTYKNPRHEILTPQYEISCVEKKRWLFSKFFFLKWSTFTNASGKNFMIILFFIV